MVITNEIIEYGKSDYGGWSNKQLRALGLPSRYFKSDGGLIKGWKKFLIGLDVPVEKINMFYELRNAHIKHLREKTQLLFA